MIWPNLNATAVAIAIIVSTTLLAILHVRTNAWVTGIFLLLELLALAVLAALGLFHAVRPVGDLVFHPRRRWWVETSRADAARPEPGWQPLCRCPRITGSVRPSISPKKSIDAPHLIGRTIFWAVIITVTELVPVAAVLIGAPDLKWLISSANPFGDSVRVRGGPLLYDAGASLAIAFAIINAALATLLQNARFLFSTGRDLAWHRHINDGFTRTHSRFRSPWIASARGRWVVSSHLFSWPEAGARANGHRNCFDLCGRLRRRSRRSAQRDDRISGPVRGSEIE